MSSAGIRPGLPRRSQAPSPAAAPALRGAAVLVALRCQAPLLPSFATGEEFCLAAKLWGG